MRWFTSSFLIGVALLCGAFAAEPAQAQPNGSYLETYRNVSVAGKYRPDALLTAQCQTKKGYWRESSLYYKSCRGGCRRLQRQRQVERTHLLRASGVVMRRRARPLQGAPRARTPLSQL